MDIHKRIMDILNMTVFLDINNSFKDILKSQKMMYVPKGYNEKIDLWISKNRIMDILNSRLLLDILKYI